MSVKVKPIQPTPTPGAGAAAMVPWQINRIRITLVLPPEIAYLEGFCRDLR